MTRVEQGTTVELIRLEEIRKTYARGTIEVPVLRGLSLSIARGEMVALMGSSGSGKTTLINLLGFLDRPTSGRYWLEGRDVTRLGEPERAWLRSMQVGFVFQNFNLLPRLTALENVMLPLTYGAHDVSQRECRAAAEALLDRVGLGDRLDHEPSRLSGGEQQRVAIARALINGCTLLIADEPTGNLDSKTGEEILALFRQLNVEDGITVLLVTHDPAVASHAGRIIRMRDGLVFDDESATSPPRHAASRAEDAAIGDPGRAPPAAQHLEPSRPARGVVEQRRGPPRGSSHGRSRRPSVRSAATSCDRP